MDNKNYCKKCIETLEKIKKLEVKRKTLIKRLKRAIETINRFTK